jgi:hypothetical protein
VGGTELRSTAQAGRVPDSKKVCFKNGMNTNRYFLWLPCRRAPGLALAEPRTGAVVRQNDGQSERLLRTYRARGLARRDGAAAGRRPLAAAVLNPRWWNRSLSRPSAASLAALNAVVAGADLLAEPRTGAVVRQNDGQSERLLRTYRALLARRAWLAGRRPLAATCLNPHRWNRSLPRPSAASLAALNAVVAGADLLAEPRTGAVVRQNDGQSERLLRTYRARGLARRAGAAAGRRPLAAAVLNPQVVEPLALAAFGRFARGSERGGCGCRSAGRAANGGRRSPERRPE